MALVLVQQSAGDGAAGGAGGAGTHDNEISFVSHRSSFRDFGIALGEDAASGRGSVAMARQRCQQAIAVDFSERVAWNPRDDFQPLRQFVVGDQPTGVGENIVRPNSACGFSQFDETDDALSEQIVRDARNADILHGRDGWRARARPRRAKCLSHRER